MQNIPNIPRVHLLPRQKGQRKRNFRYQLETKDTFFSCAYMPQNNQHEQHFITAYFARFSRSIATVEVKYDWFNYIMHFYARKWTLAIFFHLWFWQVSLKLTVARHPELHLTEVWITMSTSVHCNVSSGSWALIKIISIFNKHNHSSASGVVKAISHGSRIPHVLDSPSQVLSALWWVQSYIIWCTQGL